MICKQSTRIVPYYDPATGQFTQTDPIGLAGGLNAYGFAAGDPVSYSDPYGLNVECKTQAACETFARIYRQALAASRSSDPLVANSGQQIANMMVALIRDDETLIISVEDVGVLNRLRNKGNGTSPCEDVPRICEGQGDFGLLVDPKADHGRNVSADSRFAHELGHAYAYMVLGREDDASHDYESVQAENYYRTIHRCELRQSHSSKSPDC